MPLADLSFNTHAMADLGDGGGRPVKRAASTASEERWRSNVEVMPGKNRGVQRDQHASRKDEDHASKTEEVWLLI